MNIYDGLLKAIEVAIDRYLDLDPTIKPQLAELAGKVVAVELKGTGITFYLCPTASGIQLLSNYDREPDATLSGAPFSMLRLGLDSSAVDTMLSGAVEIRGDSELGQRFQTILNAIDVDWEEQLSKLTGDVVAHQFGNMARNANQWLTETVDSVALDVGEYLQEESRDLPHPSQVERFVADVDQIRMGVDRLDARVNRLTATLSKRES